MSTTFRASGVTVTDLASVAGPGVNGAPGSIRFSAEPVSGGPLETRLIFFAESLGTFGTGYQLSIPSASIDGRPIVEPPEVSAHRARATRAR